MFAGHAHNYERLIEDNNFPYFVDGLGGEEDTQTFDTIETGSQVRYDADFGAMLINADQTQMTFQFITRTGAVIDTYTIPAPIPHISTTLVASGSVWKYLDNGSNQGTAWQGTSFNDSSWSSGFAQLGYGDGDEQTVVGYGPNASNKYVTTYFRRSFTVSDPSVAVDGLTVNLLRDDGAVVYLNGTEVLRSNMPTGTIGYQTLASSAITGSGESAWYSIPINPALLVAGTNVLAVEIHQVDPTSSDISFDLSLIGTRNLGTVYSLGVTGIPSSTQAAQRPTVRLPRSIIPATPQLDIEARSISAAATARLRYRPITRSLLLTTARTRLARRSRQPAADRSLRPIPSPARSLEARRLRFNRQRPARRL